MPAALQRHVVLRSVGSSRPNYLLLTRPFRRQALLLRRISRRILFRFRNQADPPRIFYPQESECANRRTFSGVGAPRLFFANLLRRNPTTPRRPLSAFETSRIFDAANSSLLGT